MTQHYCFECASKLGFTVERTTTLTGSDYQLGKFMKHTVPPNTPPERTTSIFNSPDYDSYVDWYVGATISGSVELDDQGRYNIVWLAGRDTGVALRDGRADLDCDSVKVVLAHEADRVHLYPLSAGSAAVRLCDECGSPASIVD